MKQALKTYRVFVEIEVTYESGETVEVETIESDCLLNTSDLSEALDLSTEIFNTFVSNERGESL